MQSWGGKEIGVPRAYLAVTEDDLGRRIQLDVFARVSDVHYYIFDFDKARSCRVDLVERIPDLSKLPLATSACRGATPLRRS